MIGHEITAVYGLAHAESLAIVLPGVMSVMRESKKEKMIQYSKKVLGLDSNNEEFLINKAIELTEEFFKRLGQKTRLSDYGLDDEVAFVISERIGKYPTKLGERKNIGKDEVREILLLRK